MRERCGKWMPRAKTYCARVLDHADRCRGAAVLERKRLAFHAWHSIPGNAELHRQTERAYRSIPENAENGRQRIRAWQAVPENRDRSAARNRRRYLQYAIERDTI